MIAITVPQLHGPFTILTSDLSPSNYRLSIVLKLTFIVFVRRVSMTAKPSSLPLRRILLAEDDESMRGFLVKALEKADYDVVAFENGEDAFERLKHEPFTLLLTDIVMPKMDGIELARRAAELDPDLKIMFITGFAAVVLNSDNAPPKDSKVLSKPFHLKDLVREVDRLLAA